MMKSFLTIPVMLLVLTLVGEPVTGAHGQCIDPAGQMRTATTIAIETEYFDLVGDYLYAAPDYGDGEFHVYDVSNPSSPFLAGSATVGPIEDLAYAGGFVYAVGGDEGIVIIDVHDPSTPNLRGSAATPTPGEGYRVAIEGQRAYVLDASEILNAYSIADPDNPYLLGSIQMPDTTWEMCAAGDRVYLAVYNHGILVVDVSDPAAMSIIWTVPGSDKADVVAEDNGTICAVTRRFSDNSEWFWVLDPGDPDTPTIRSALKISGLYDLDVHNGIAYIGAEEGFVAIDVSDPADPRVIGANNGAIWTLSVSDMIACKALWDGGLQLVELGDSTAPHMIGLADVRAQGGGHLVIEGDYGLFANATYGLKIFDLTDPATSEILGSYKSSDFTYGVAVNGEIAFVAEINALTSLSYQGAGDPVVLDSVATPGSAQGVAVKGNYVFVADLHPTLSVYEASPDGILSFMSSLDLPAQYGEIIVLEDNRAYVHGDDAINIIDISDPTNPVHLGTAPAGPYAVAFDVVGYNLFVPYNTDVVIYDVSDPANVVEISRMAAVGNYMEGVSVSNNIAYVCAWDERVSAYDIADISNPVYMNDLYNDGNQINGVWTHEDRVYISGYDLTILQSYCAPVRNSLHVPSEYPTIQAAVNAAGPGDEIVIACGTYLEHDILVPHAVTIRGESGEASCVVIDAEGLGRIFDIDLPGPPVQEIRLEGLTLRNGLHPIEGDSGGAIICWWAILKITDCVLEDNFAYNGGAISIHIGELQLTNTQFDRNVAVNFGQAVVLWSWSTANVANCSFSSNGNDDPRLSTSSWGTIHLHDNSSLHASDSVFDNNKVLGSGGAISSFSSNNLTLQNCTGTRNEAREGAFLYARQLSDVELSNLLLTENVHTESEGYISGTVHLVFEEPSSNPSPISATLIGNTISRNSHGLDDAGIYLEGISISAPFTLTIERNLVAQNSGYGIKIDVTLPTAPTVNCNDLYGNTMGDWVETVAEWGGINNNVSVDPLFCDPTNGDYQVDYTSPCLASHSQGGCKIGALGGGCGLTTPPQGVTVNYEPSGVTVAWGAPAKAAPLGVDAIAFYRIYRSNLLGFTPGPETLVHEAESSPWVDGGGELGDFYMVSSVDANGSESVAVGPQDAANTGIPIVHVGALFQNTPNPFNPSTLISYVLPKAGHAHLGIYDIRGRRVATLLDEHHDAGPGQVHWDGKDSFGALAGSGVYFYRLNSPEFEQVKRMVLLK